MRDRNRMWPVAVVAACFAVASETHAQVPAGGEFRANTYTIGAQGAPVVGRAPGGDFVMAWQDEGQDGDGYGIFAQRYDASGAPQGAEFGVNTYTTGDQTRPWLAADGGGRFVVVWNTTNATPDGSGGSVHGQRFAADGARLGAEFIVNTYTTGDQYWARVAVNRAGSFIVAWQSSQDGSGTSIHAQRFDRNGQTLLGEFQVNLTTLGDQVTPDVKINNLGRFAVVWAGPDGSDSGIFGRAFNENGAPAGTEVLLNSVTAGTQAFPSLHGSRTGDPDDFPSVVAWESFGQDGSDYGVFARQFRGFGAPQGPEFQVNVYTTGAQGGQPLAAMDEGGNFVIAWRTGPQDGSAEAVMARRFAPSGQPRSPELVVNTYATGSQDQAHVAVDPFGNFVVAWRSALQDGSSSGVFAQRFQGLHPRAIGVDASGNGVLDPGETVDVEPGWQNLNGTTQAFGGNLALFAGPCIQSVPDTVANYGSVANGTTATCSDCYAVSAGSLRCVQHWDFTAIETLVPDIQGQVKRWVIHVGDSFADVPSTGPSPFYRFIETLLHHGVTGGCSGSDYCPLSATSREQMAVFVLVAKEGAGYGPPPCGTPVFNDVPATSPFCRWIEELARRGVVSGCGGGNYCPTTAATREQMAVFVLRTLDPALNPPACTTPMFADVPASSPFCRWIEELARRGVVSGCGGGNYCPAAAVTREQMSVFLGATFGLTLYGV